MPPTTTAGGRPGFACAPPPHGQHRVSEIEIFFSANDLPRGPIRAVLMVILPKNRF